MADRIVKKAYVSKIDLVDKPANGIPILAMFSDNGGKNMNLEEFVKNMDKIDGADDIVTYARNLMEIEKSLKEKEAEVTKMAEALKERELKAALESAKTDVDSLSLPEEISENCYKLVEASVKGEALPREEVFDVIKSVANCIKALKGEFDKAHNTDSGEFDDVGSDEAKLLAALEDKVISGTATPEEEEKYMELKGY